MRIAVLQFAPQLGDVELNMTRAEGVLDRENPKDLDLIVLPEMAFTGYNFKSLAHIYPYLEPTDSGITSLWARMMALKHNCVVTVGYPEKVDITGKWPASPEYYNSAITINAEGETIANYRKTFLFFRDETWALEGPDGFFDGEIDGLGNVVMGICKWPTRDIERMDMNPYKFQAPLHAWEFAYHILHKQANLVILSMAWMTDERHESYSRNSTEPDMEALSYWISRLEPVIRSEDHGEIIVILANRCGVEDDAVYTGTSCVIGIENGEVKLYGVLSRGEKRLLVVDTSEIPEAKLVQEGNMKSTSNNTYPREKEPMSSIDARISETIPLSPVEPSRQQSFFNAQLALLSRESPELNSASSLYVNTPWDLTPSSFRAEDLTRIINNRSPKSANLKTSSSAASVQVSPPTSSPQSLQAPLPDSSRQVQSSSPSLHAPSPAPTVRVSGPPVPPPINTKAEPPNRPAAPKVRNSSRTRPIEQNPPTLATQNLANPDLSASMVMSPTRNLNLSEGNRALRGRMAMSATTNPGQFFTGENRATPQPRMAVSAITPHSKSFPTSTISTHQPRMAFSAGSSSSSPYVLPAEGSSNAPRTRTERSTSPIKPLPTIQDGNSPRPRAASNTSTSPARNVTVTESTNSPTTVVTTSPPTSSTQVGPNNSPRARVATNVSTSPVQNLPPGEASNSPRAAVGEKGQK